MSKFYGLAYYTNSKGELKRVIIRKLQSEDRLSARREAQLIAMSRGYIFEAVYPTANYRVRRRLS